jgi:hypothetical protein
MITSGSLDKSDAVMAAASAEERKHNRRCLLAAEDGSGNVEMTLNDGTCDQAYFATDCRSSCLCQSGVQTWSVFWLVVYAVWK